MDEKVEHVLQEVEAHRVAFVRLQFTDILGIPKNVEIPVEKLAEAFERGVAFDGSSIEGFVRISESDMYLVPDPETLAFHPWSGKLRHGEEPVGADGTRTARLICDVHLPDNTPFPGDPRYALKQASARAREQGFTMYAGPEPEFFLLRRDEGGQPTTEVHDQGGYFDLLPVDLGEETRKDIVVALEQMGFQVEAAHHEVAPGQHEIDFRYAEALTTADNLITFKVVAKTIALFKGLHATFMPKPIAGVNGSGMHTHLSLFRDGANAFHDPSDPYGLSEVARHFMGGLIHHIRALTAITNPLVNSYKRLVPGYEAPVNISWARINRSALIRVPASNTPEVSTRIELRSPDPACNPYLAFAAILCAGLDGIRRRIKPPDPVEENIYELSEAERAQRKIGTLPGSLGEALEALEADEVVQDALGEHILRKYLEAKTRELQAYRMRVTPWELQQYLAYY